MNDLSDNEIIGTILSITGAKSAGMLMNGKQFFNWNGKTWNGFDALHDDALCFQLMVEYEVCFSPNHDFAYIKTNEKCFTINDRNTHNKAILLAIIEAHNG